MSIHRIELISGLNESPSTNTFLCCAPCQEVVLTFQNVHTTSLTVTAFTDTWLAKEFNFTILEINGLSPSFPFIVAEDEVFTMKLEICYNGSGNPQYIQPYFTTVEHNDDLEFQFDFNCIALNDILSTTYVDFGVVPVSIPSNQSFTINNTTIDEISYSFSFIGGACDGLVLPPNGSVSAGNSINPIFTFTPTLPSQNLSCNINISIGSCSQTIQVVGGSEEIICEECLCCVDIQIQTAGNYLTTDSGFCSPDVLYSKASFLDKKTIVYKMKYQSALVTGFRVQFTPGLFILECELPSELNQPLSIGYYIQYLSGAHPDGVAQTMLLNGAGSNALNLKNWEVYFRPVNAANGFFNVEFTFYVIQDYESLLTNLLWNNAKKLTRTTLSATTDWTNTLTSVYNTDKKYLSGEFYISDPATLVNDSPFACNQIACSNFAARFYNRGINNASSEFLFPQFTLSRANGIVNNFSVLEPTRITFKINIPAIYGTSAPVIVYHLFDTSINDDSVDFLTSTDSSRYRVLSYTGTAVLNNHLVAPGVAPYLNTGAWECALYVGTTVNPTSVYRVAAIVYSSNGEMVNTFLSEEIRVTRFPDMDCNCKPDFDSSFIQYWQKTKADCFQPVAKERIGHELILSEGDFGTCLADLGVTDLVWPRQLKSVRLKIYKRKDNYPTIGKTTFFEYETHYSERDFAYPGNFHNYNNLIVSDTGPNIGDDVAMTIRDIRVPWEYTPFQPGQVTTADTATYLNRTPAGGLTNSYISGAFATQTWTNEDVYFEYTFEFDLFPQVGVPFFWKTVKAFIVNAIEIEPNNGGYDQVITDVTIEGKDKLTGLYQEIEAPICFSDWDAIKLTYQATMDGDFLFFMEKEPFGFPTIMENDGAQSPFGITQSYIPQQYLLSMDMVFDPVTFKASVVLNAPNFENGKYRFCGYISFPPAQAVCEYFLRHVLDNNSSSIVAPNLFIGDTLTVTFNAATANRYLFEYVSVGQTQYPVVGETYVFEYSFTVPTTRVVDILIGAFLQNFTPTFSLPIGSTSGSVTFVWVGGTIGQWSLVVRGGTNMTTVGSFKFGTAQCP